MSIPPAYLSPPIEILAKMATAEKPPLEVQTLTTRMSRGDEAAFHEFNGLYFNRLLRYLTVVARGQEEIAQEAIQLTFVRVARSVRKFDSEKAFWNWLAMIARNCALDEMRKHGRRQNLLMRLFERQPPLANWNETETDEQFLKLLEREIAGLPADERTLIERKYFSGETASGLAVEREMTEKAMESRLLRIRRKLKTAMLDRMKDETE